MQTAFGQPDASDVRRVAGNHFVLAQHDLGGTATEVHDDERRTGAA
ncbi:Uncharacterised protein [Mycobacterium tuberculosis]|uniref:Uncharacterized protein n=1 Tax=Mycobacterium tuberculosis TaxID=1773 RepID=A0A916LHN7_MYCTX|nr:Uncharacterised protein [Mycobacterium tuberculosis]COY59869.1 Uncharacterised protein [Mycobacterium tuberculosis]CPC40819.1 Uncharacterised protein [Mycobacterium tuberculosis]